MGLLVKQTSNGLLVAKYVLMLRLLPKISQIKAIINCVMCTYARLDKMDKICGIYKFPSLFQSCLGWKPMNNYFFKTISIHVCLLAMNTVLSVAFVIVRHSTFRVEIVMRSTTRSEQHGGVGGKNKRAFWP